MINQFTSFDAFLSYFGASLFVLGLLSCFVRGYFRLGVVAMLIADIPLMFTILFPSFLHELTDQAGVSTVFNADEALIFGLSAGVATFLILFSLYYFFFKRNKQKSGKELEQKTSGKESTSSKAEAADNAKKARGSGTLRTRHSLMLNDDERPLANEKLAPLTQGLQPLDSNFLGGYAQANKNLTNITEEALFAPNDSLQRPLAEGNLTLSGLSAARDTDTSLRIPDTTNPRALGRVDDVLAAMDKGELTQNSPEKARAVPQQQQQSYSFADVLSHAQDRQSKPNERPIVAEMPATPMEHAIESVAPQKAPVEVDLVHDESEHDVQHEKSERPLSVREMEMALDAEEEAAKEQEQQQKPTESQASPSTVPEEAIESVQSALSRLEKVAPTLDPNQKSSAEKSAEPAQAAPSSPAARPAEEASRHQSEPFERQHPVAKPTQRDADLDRIGLSFTVSTSNRDGDVEEGEKSFVDRSSYTDQTKYTASFHESELDSAVRDNINASFTEKNKSKGVELYRSSVKVDVTDGEPAGEDMPTQGNDLIQSLQTHCTDIPEDESSGASPEQKQISVGKTLNMGSVSVAEALARLSSEAHAIVAAIDQAAVSHGISTKADQSDAPKSAADPLVLPSKPLKPSVLPLKTKLGGAEVGILSLSNDNELSLVNAAQPLQALKIEPVASIEPVAALESKVEAAAEPEENMPLKTAAVRALENDITVDKPISIEPPVRMSGVLDSDVSYSAMDGSGSGLSLQQSQTDLSSTSSYKVKPIEIEESQTQEEPEDLSQKSKTSTYARVQQNEVELPAFKAAQTETSTSMKEKAIQNARKHKRQMEQTSANIALQKQKHQQLLQEATSPSKVIPVQESLNRPQDVAERIAREAVVLRAQEALAHQIVDNKPLRPVSPQPESGSAVKVAALSPAKTQAAMAARVAALREEAKRKAVENKIAHAKAAEETRHALREVQKDEAQRAHFQAVTKEAMLKAAAARKIIAQKTKMAKLLNQPAPRPASEAASVAPKPQPTVSTVSVVKSARPGTGGAESRGTPSVAPVRPTPVQQRPSVEPQQKSALQQRPVESPMLKTKLAPQAKPALRAESQQKPAASARPAQVSKTVPESSKSAVHQQHVQRSGSAKPVAPSKAGVPSLKRVVHPATAPTSIPATSATPAAVAPASETPVPVPAPQPQTVAARATHSLKRKTAARHHNPFNAASRELQSLNREPSKGQPALKSLKQRRASESKVLPR